MCVRWDLSRTCPTSLSRHWDLSPFPRLFPALGGVVRVRLHTAVMLPASGPDALCRLNEERQGTLLCALVEHRQVPSVPLSLDSPLEPVTVDGGDICSEQALEVPTQVLAILSEYKLLFPDSLPAGLPPNWAYDHRTILLPGKLPTKAVIDRMPPDQLAFHKHEIAKLSKNGRIGPTYSPICAPSLMVDKQADG